MIGTQDMNKKRFPYAAFPTLFVYVGIVISSVFFSYTAMARHDNFHSRKVDLGNMVQPLWNLVHGNGFTLTDPFSDVQISRLGIHADVLLAFLAPLYALWQDPKVLLLIQAIMVSLGALPVYWIARRAIKSDVVGAVFALAYLLNPSVERMMLHDFHAVALSMTLLLFSYWFMETKRYGWFIVFALLAAAGKENVWLVTGLMGLYLFWKHKKKALGSAVAIASFVMFYILFWHVIPSHVAAGKHFALSYLSEYGDDQSGIVKGLVLHPLSVIHTVFLPDRLFYYLQLLAPVGFLPLFAPFALVFAIPTLVINVLSSNELMRQISYQYTSTITPFLFVSSIGGYVWLMNWLNASTSYLTGYRRGLVTGVLLSSLAISSFCWGEIPLTANDRFYYFIWPLPETATMHRIEHEIDSRYSVSATNDIGAHFANRKVLYNFPIGALRADYVVARRGDYFAWPDKDTQDEALGQLLRSPEYEVLVIEGDFYAFKRIDVR